MYITTILLRTTSFTHSPDTLILRNNILHFGPDLSSWVMYIHLCTQGVTSVISLKMFAATMPSAPAQTNQNYQSVSWTGAGDAVVTQTFQKAQSLGVEIDLQRYWTLVRAKLKFISSRICDWPDYQRFVHGSSQWNILRPGYLFSMVFHIRMERRDFPESTPPDSRLLMLVKYAYPIFSCSTSHELQCGS